MRKKQECDWCDCASPEILIVFGNSATGEIVDGKICQTGMNAIKSHTRFNGKGDIWLFTKRRRFVFDMWESRHV